jgi:uncharacterized membrane protein YhaH (DUF805 family)
MGFQEAIRTVWGKYTDFSGRARRSEYWFWALALIIAEIIVAILLRIAWPLGFIAWLALICATIVPSLAVLWRRLHDTGKSGWWVLIGFVPFVGGIILLVFVCLDSQPQPNQWGPSPKAGAVGYAAPPPPPAAPPAAPPPPPPAEPPPAPAS